MGGEHQLLAGEIQDERMAEQRGLYLKLLIYLQGEKKEAGTWRFLVLVLSVNHVVQIYSYGLSLLGKILDVQKIFTGSVI